MCGGKLCYGLCCSMCEQEVLWVVLWVCGQEVLWIVLVSVWTGGVMDCVGECVDRRCYGLCWWVCGQEVLWIVLVSVWTGGVMDCVGECVNRRWHEWHGTEGLCNEKFQWHHRSNERSTFRLVAQCLNQLRHREPPWLYWHSRMNCHVV